MAFPENWGQEAADRLAAMAERTVDLAMERAGAWTTPSPWLRAAVRYSAGYDADAAARLEPADTFGRRVLRTAPHFEIRVEPGDRWRPAGATFYRTGARQAARVLKGEWGSIIFTDLSPRAAREMAEAILGPLGDGEQTPTRAPLGRAVAP